tara:strand:+ start:180 stop:548 length:369 start_codon:yes stop_codon:yes gene_type:complete
LSSEVFNPSSSASQVCHDAEIAGVKDTFAFAGLARKRATTRVGPDTVVQLHQVAPRPWETVGIGVQNVMQQREDHSNEVLRAGMIDAVSRIRTVVVDLQVWVDAIADGTDALRVRELRCEEW